MEPVSGWQSRGDGYYAWHVIAVGTVRVKGRVYIPCLGEYFSFPLDLVVAEMNLQTPQPSCYQPENEGHAEGW